VLEDHDLEPPELHDPVPGRAAGGIAAPLRAPIDVAGRRRRDFDHEERRWVTEHVVVRRGPVGHEDVGLEVQFRADVPTPAREDFVGSGAMGPDEVDEVRLRSAVTPTGRVHDTQPVVVLVVFRLAEGAIVLVRHRGAERGTAQELFGHGIQGKPSSSAVK
jgi:hypothetical protein